MTNADAKQGRDRLLITRQMIAEHYERDGKPLPMTDLALAICREQGLDVPDLKHSGHASTVVRELCQFSAFQTLHISMRTDYGHPWQLLKNTPNAWGSRYGWEDVPAFSYTTTAAAAAQLPKASETRNAYWAAMREEETHKKATEKAHEALVERYPVEFAALLLRFTRELKG